jgi:hypothetical protein
MEQLVLHRFQRKVTDPSLLVANSSPCQCRRCRRCAWPSLYSEYSSLASVRLMYPQWGETGTSNRQKVKTLRMEQPRKSTTCSRTTDGYANECPANLLQIWMYSYDVEWCAWKPANCSHLAHRAPLLLVGQATEQAKVVKASQLPRSTCRSVTSPLIAAWRLLHAAVKA